MRDRNGTCTSATLATAGAGTALMTGFLAYKAYTEWDAGYLLATVAGGSLSAFAFIGSCLACRRQNTGVNEGTQLNFVLRINTLSQNNNVRVPV